ncbi:hypothetical protein ABIA30_000176 [Mycobacterium sp. MAA66]|uniref:hypothetical protein n=1 Tax=Mycobacterium sp. MAA66 TaxID=3156297 RepID=UPI00351453B7
MAQNNSWSGNGSGGASSAGQPPQVGSPQPVVTVGDGRNPAAQLPKPAPTAIQSYPAPVQMVAAPRNQLTPTSIAIRGGSQQTPDDPELTIIERGVMPLLAAAQPDDFRDIYLGVTGFLLVPLAGLWLGYRQERAQRAAEQILRD